MQVSENNHLCRKQGTRLCRGIYIIYLSQREYVMYNIKKMPVTFLPPKSNPLYGRIFFFKG